MAFRDAASFRFSHYFVSYLSEGTALLSGVWSIGCIRGNGASTAGGELTVCSSVQVEAPRSLVEVVMHWNIPIHTWLKQCKCQTARNTQENPVEKISKNL